MADTRETYEILEDASGNGVAASQSQEGNPSSGKNGMTVFNSKDNSGNLRLSKVNASDQAEVEVKASALPTGAATEATLATRATESTLATRASESTLGTVSTRIGDLTETAPASDTESSGLNGRLQRIAQRITSLIAQIPATLGQKTMANSLAVVVASDQSQVPVTNSTRDQILNDNGSSFNSCTNLQNKGTSESAFFFFKNPSGSGKTIKINSIRVHASGCTFRTYLNPTTSANGTAVSAFNSHAGNGTASVATVFFNPTASANGSLIGIVATSAQFSNYEVCPPNGIILDANNTLLITTLAGANNTPCAVTISWVEV